MVICFNFFSFFCVRPIVFVIKDFDSFEANLVMSTLSPEDMEAECQRSRSAAQANSQHSITDNIGLDKTHVDDDGCGNSVEIIADKEPIAHEENSKKRNLSLVSGSDFESSISKHASLDIVIRNKKRRTSNEHRRDTHMPASNGTHPTNQNEISALPPPYVDLESENIEVVFQDTSPEQNSPQNLDSNGIESMDVDMELNEAHIGNVRDHRPFVRQVFGRCFTGNAEPSNPYGETLVECSDEEQ